MFKPSLRKSILKDNLCIGFKTQKNAFTVPQQQKRTPVPRIISKTTVKPVSNLPSMMIPQEILQKSTFYNDLPFTHVFTPLVYDFEAYPRQVQQIVKNNFEAAQAGRINEINYIVYENNLIFWTDKDINPKSERQQVNQQKNKKDRSTETQKDDQFRNNRDRSAEKYKAYKFRDRIDIIGFSTIKNQQIFHKQQVTIMAVTFGNRIKLFSLDQTNKELRDLMTNYKLKGSRKIQNFTFSQHNEIAFSGDNGKLFVISLNNFKGTVLKTKESSFSKKYLSKSAFDYSTFYNVRQIQFGQQFLYCLNDRISKSSYLMYLLKRAINKVILLSEEPKYITEETFIDIYKFTSDERKQIQFIDRISQADIQLQVKEGYANFWGESVQNAFRIISINAKGQRKNVIQNNAKSGKIEETSKQMVENTQQQFDLDSKIQIITKCGYVLSLIHRSVSPQKEKLSFNTQRFSFFSHPTKLPQKIGEASLFEPKVILLSQQKQYRKNLVIKSLPLAHKQDFILTNNYLMFKANLQLSMVRFNHLKIALYETTNQQEFYLPEVQFKQKYETFDESNRQENKQDNIFGVIQHLRRENSAAKTRYYRLFNNQRRWTVFDNQGRFNIYLMELKHIILAYIHFQCDVSNFLQRGSAGFNLNNNFFIQSDLQLHSIIQKVIKVYGYCNFMKSLIQILINNSNDQREYFYFQKDLFLEVVKKQFQLQMPNAFEDWIYGLEQHSKAQIVVPTQKIMRLLWITLFQHQNKSPLGTQDIQLSYPTSEYSYAANQYEDARSELRYSAYGFALKALFADFIDVLIYFRAKDFKIKEKQLSKCRHKLVQLFSYLQSKNNKSQNIQYKRYLQIKLSNHSRKKQMYHQKFGTPNHNATFTTAYSASLNNSLQSVLGTDDDQYIRSSSKGVVQKSNDSIEKDICRSIQKIITLIDVMHILIEKDERQGLPNFIQIITNFKNQIKLGECFFNQELLISEGKVQFLHPELVIQVQKQLPQLQLQKRIDFLKFKVSRNIATDNQNFNDLDLKSLDFYKLSSIISTSQLLELRRMFMGQKQEVNFEKADYYIEFLSICLSKMIEKVKEFSGIKQSKFKSLSNQVKKYQGVSSLISHLTVQSIVLAQQQLQYYQQQMAAFFEEIKNIFSISVHSLKKITGPKYYQSQNYLQRMIEVLIQNFPSEEILVQALQIILKEAGLLEKNHFMKQLKQRILSTTKVQPPILRISKEKQSKITEKSTLQYLLAKNHKKSLDQRTFDTQATESINRRN